MLVIYFRQLGPNSSKKEQDRYGPSFSFEPSNTQLQLYFLYFSSELWCIVTHYYLLEFKLLLLLLLENKVVNAAKVRASQIRHLDPNSKMSTNSKGDKRESERFILWSIRSNFIDLRFKKAFPPANASSLNEFHLTSVPWIKEREYCPLLTLASSYERV